MRIRAFGLATLLCLSTTAVSFGGDYMNRGKKNRQYLEPDGEHAVVYFVRGSAMGMAIRFWTFAGETPLGLTRGRTYFGAKLPAGETMVWAKAENVSTLNLSLEAGKTYFVKQGVGMGIGKARVELSRMDPEKGEKLIRKLAFSELTEDGIERGNEIVRKRYDRAIELAGRR